MLSCKHCGIEFGPNERPYHSRQAGMKGWYHWQCFIKACRTANDEGERKIAIALAVERHPPKDFWEIFA